MIDTQIYKNKNLDRLKVDAMARAITSFSKIIDVIVYLFKPTLIQKEIITNNVDINSDNVDNVNNENNDDLMNNIMNMLHNTNKGVKINKGNKEN